MAHRSPPAALSALAFAVGSIALPAVALPAGALPAVAIPAVALSALAPRRASAQDLPTRATSRAVRAAVRITARSAEGNVSTGSGSIIDHRGFILTNFHVIGHTRPRGGGAPGEFINPNNRVELAMAGTARERAETRYLGEVVRGDVRLDLAIVRIISDANGDPVPAGTRFPTVPLADTSRLRPGTRLFAFGFPLGVQTINVTSGEMSGFQMNSREEVAWIRTDAEFNPGNSGGMLLDRRGHLVAVPTAVYSDRGTLEPIELARPVERIPDEWRQGLRRGRLDGVEVDGLPQLVVGQDFTEEAVGDGGSFSRPELHYYRMPTQRPARVGLRPTLLMALMDGRGRIVREGRGLLETRRGDPEDLFLAVLIPARDDEGGGTLILRYEVRAGHDGPPGWDALPPPGGR